MSKQSASAWRRRVFRNSYTRRGRLLRVQGWCVKLQHHGQRRTIRLGASTRAAAAHQARRAYELLQIHGWDAARVGGSIPKSHAASMSSGRHSLRFWRDRLLQRSYEAPGAVTPRNVWVVRLEAVANHAWFPVGDNLDSAALQAKSIHRSIAAKGWDAALRHHPREITVAFHWCANPLKWTYATIINQPEKQPRLVGLSFPCKTDLTSRYPVILVDADTAVRRAMEAWLAQQTAATLVAACNQFPEALEGHQRLPSALWVVNRHGLSHAPHGWTTGHWMPEGHRPLGVLEYSVHPDSGELFMSTPGGAAAYLLKRVSPAQILDPLAGASPADLLKPGVLDNLVRAYFEQAGRSAGASDSMRRLEALTQREREILERLSQGFLDKEIADQLGISAWTVHGHVKKIFGKLRVHTRTEAAVRFLQR